MKRPPFCIVEDCAPVREFHLQDRQYLAAGGSYFCAGILREREVWRARDVDHLNSWCLCIYSPFKGWVRFMICEDDAKIIVGLIQRLREKSRGKTQIVRRE